MAEIPVAIAGVGNCASALVQGVEYYKNLGENVKIPGLMHVNFGGYHVRDIRFVAAFDVNKQKVGKDLGEAVFAEPNCCAKFTDVPHLGVKVLAAPILDGVASHMRTPFKIYNEGEMQPVDVKDILKEVEAEVLVNLIPVGSYEATRYYAQAALDSNCAFVNCIPEFI
ncbi:MAG: inositol-3-phosphate synthase, partial [Gammaproteobacteria bacterium]|nr:inositol-3-phosphate synthase [Gammaproteobacteria bacterium]